MFLPNLVPFPSNKLLWSSVAITHLCPITFLQLIMSSKLTKNYKYADGLSKHINALCWKTKEFGFYPSEFPVLWQWFVRHKIGVFENLWSIAKSDSPVYFKTLDSIKDEAQQHPSFVGGKNIEVCSIHSCPPLLLPVVGDDGSQALATPLFYPRDLLEPIWLFVVVIIQVDHGIKPSL